MNYTLHIRSDCKVMRDKKLLLRVIESLPNDIKIRRIEFDWTKQLKDSCYIFFESEIELGSPNLILQLEEKIEISFQPYNAVIYK